MSELIRLAEYWEGFFDEYGPSENDHSAEAGAYRLAKAHLEALDKMEAAEQENARLREALEKKASSTRLVDIHGSNCGICNEARIAQQLLKENK